MSEPSAEPEVAPVAGVYGSVSIPEPTLDTGEIDEGLDWYGDREDADSDLWAIFFTAIEEHEKRLAA